MPWLPQTRRVPQTLRVSVCRAAQLVENGLTYNQTWDVENRLVAVTNTSTLSVTQFMYDGDGQRAKRVEFKPGTSATVTTVYVGNYFEAELRGPNAPSGLSAGAASASQINLAWTDNSNNESGFRIERSPNGSSWSEIATVGANATSYPNTGLTCGTTYYYRVRAYNGVGNSNYGNTVSATTSACPTLPAAPSNLVAADGGSGTIYLTWTDNSNNEDGFKIEQSSDGLYDWAEVDSTGPNVTSATEFLCGVGYRPSLLQLVRWGEPRGWMIPTPPPGNTLVFYRVRAYNASGYSGYSVPVRFI
jgi:YD repeat-containing protein